MPVCGGYRFPIGAWARNIFSIAHNTGVAVVCRNEYSGWSESGCVEGRVMTAGDGLIDAIAEAVALKLERMAGCSQRLLDIDQAAQYLGLSPVALRHKAGIDVPCVRIDTKLRFDRRDLDRFIDRARREGV